MVRVRRIDPRRSAARARILAASSVLGAGLLVVACSLTTDLDGLSGGAPDGGASDGGDRPLDAEADVTGRDAASDAGLEGSVPPPRTNLVTNGDFETAGDGCGPPWYPDPSAQRSSDRPHSGTYACRVCRRDANIPYFGVDSPASLAPSGRAGDSFRATAWMRKVTAGATNAELHLRVFAADESTPQNESTPIILTSEWTQVERSITLQQDIGGGRLNLYVVVLDAPVDECFEVDDIELTPL